MRTLSVARINPSGSTRPGICHRQFRIDAEEQHALAQLSTAVGWGDVSPPNEFSVITITDPLAGTQHRSDPYMTVLGEFARRPEPLQRQPSKHVLPAIARRSAEGLYRLERNGHCLGEHICPPSLCRV